MFDAVHIFYICIFNFSIFFINFESRIFYVTRVSTQSIVGDNTYDIFADTGHRTHIVSKSGNGFCIFSFQRN